MKNVKLFLCIATVSLLVFALVSCDVFDRSGRWGRAGAEDLGSAGKLYDSFDATPDLEDKGRFMPPAPDPGEEIILSRNLDSWFLIKILILEIRLGMFTLLYLMSLPHPLLNYGSWLTTTCVKN